MNSLDIAILLAVWIIGCAMVMTFTAIGSVRPRMMPDKPRLKLVAQG
jgi:hypothetical protein